VIGGDDPLAFGRRMPPTPVGRHLKAASEERLGGRSTQTHDDPGLDDLDFLSEPYGAGLPLGRRRGPVLPSAADGLEGPALDDVCDVEVRPGEAHGLEGLVEEAASRSDEGPARLVLDPAGTLADEHDEGIQGAFPEDDLGPGLGQMAPGALEGCRP